MNAASNACCVCRAPLIEDMAWECCVCGASVHPECCDGSTLVRAPASQRLSSTCRSCTCRACGADAETPAPVDPSRSVG